MVFAAYWTHLILARKRKIANRFDAVFWTDSPLSRFLERLSLNRVRLVVDPKNSSLLVTRRISGKLEIRCFWRLFNNSIFSGRPLHAQINSVIAIGTIFIYLFIFSYTASNAIRVVATDGQTMHVKSQLSRRRKRFSKGNKSNCRLDPICIIYVYII